MPLCDLMGVVNKTVRHTGGSMHSIQLLHKWLKKSCSRMHLMRIGALVKVVEGLLGGGRLALTHLGRNLRSHAFAKHNIKCVDRLLGNRYLHRERFDVYKAMAEWLLSATPRPVILVDWSDCGTNRELLMLKAAIPLGGRALSVYEEVHPLSQHNKPKVHKRFLQKLHAVLPEKCNPIIVTDAGFRGPWFREVERLGWDWVGRVRSSSMYKLGDAETWKKAASLYSEATPKPRYVGHVLLARYRPYACYLYLLRKYQRGAGRPLKRHGQNIVAQRCRKQQKDPWLIASSLGPRGGGARRVMKLYALRMQIEETFRDFKSHRWGFGLQYSGSRSTARLEILLLIGTLAMLINWLVGLAGKKKKWGRHFQANTIRERTVLSVCFLGQQLLHDMRFLITPAAVLSAAKLLPMLVLENVELA